jgi:hypothetical protein
MIRRPTPIPIIGARTMNSSVFIQPDHMTALNPAFAIAAPA